MGRQKLSLGKVPTKDDKWIASQTSFRRKNRNANLEKARKISKTPKFVKKVKDQTYFHERSMTAYEDHYKQVIIFLHSFSCS